MTDAESYAIPGLTEDQTNAFMSHVFDRNVRAHIGWAVRTTAPDGKVVSFKACENPEEARQWIVMLDSMAVGEPHHVGAGYVHEVVRRAVVCGPWETVQEEES